MFVNIRIVWRAHILRILEQAIGSSGGPGVMRYLHHNYHHHSIHAGRLECGCRRISSDAGQCRFSYEGSGPVCGFILFAEAGCGESVSVGGFGQGMNENLSENEEFGLKSMENASSAQLTIKRKIRII